MHHFVLNGSFLLQPRLVKKIIMTNYIVISPITIGKKNIMTIFIVILLLRCWGIIWWNFWKNLKKSQFQLHFPSFFPAKRFSWSSKGIGVLRASTCYEKSCPSFKIALQYIEKQSQILHISIKLGSQNYYCFRWPDHLCYSFKQETH